MSNRRLKQAVTEFKTYLNDNPNVDNETLSRLQLLRDRLVNFITVDDKQTELVDDSNSLAELTDVIEKEIIAVEAKHPELTRKLDIIMRNLAKSGI